MPDDILGDERGECVEFTRAKSRSGGTVRSGIRMLGAHLCSVGAVLDWSRTMRRPACSREDCTGRLPLRYGSTESDDQCVNTVLDDPAMTPPSLKRGGRSYAALAVVIAVGVVVVTLVLAWPS